MGWNWGRKREPEPPGPRRPPKYPECAHCRSQSPLVWTGRNLDLHLCGFCADREIARMAREDEAKREVQERYGSTLGPLAFEPADRASRRVRYDAPVMVADVGKKT